MPALLVLAPILLAALSVYHFIIQPVFLSPLAKIPTAHPTAAFSPLWLLWVRYSARENKTLYAAHSRLGPVIRIAPNEVSVCCQENGVKVIYGKGWEKPQWHEAFENFGVSNLFSTRWSGPHAIRKRRISNIFSKSYLHSSADFAALVRTIIYDRYLPLISGHAARRELVNVVELNYSAMMDVASAYLLGLPNSSNFLQDVEFRRNWLKGYRSRIPHMFWIYYLPNFTTWAADRLGINFVPKYVDDVTADIEAWCMGLCNKAEASIAAAGGKEVKPGDAPVVYRQLRSAWEQERKKEGKEITPDVMQSGRLEVASEMLDDLVAAHETSGITMTYVLWELSRDLSLQNRLYNELLTLDPSTSFSIDTPSLPPPKAVDSLPLLDAVLMETLRRHSSLQGPLHRVTPPNATLGPYSGLPANVVVHANAYTLHRNPEMFPDPEKYWPERWFEEDGDAGRKETWLWSFGSGGRMCVGSHLAILSMKHVISAIYRNYTTRIVDDEGIEQEDGFIVGPRGNKLVLVFEPRK